MIKLVMLLALCSWAAAAPTNEEVHFPIPGYN